MDWYRVRCRDYAHPQGQETQGCAFRSRLRDGFAFGWMVFAGDGAHGDGKAVPRIDRGDGIGQVDELVFGEFLACLLVEFIGRVVLRNEGQGFSPGQGSAFARSEERRFAPGIERVKDASPYLRRRERLSNAYRCNRRSR